MARAGARRARVSASLIVRDGVETIERCIASVRPHVDEVCVVDTGSTDGTLDLLERLAAKPGAPIRVTEHVWSGHFGETRTLALETCTHPWVLSIDADELLMGGENLRREIAAAERTGKTCLVFSLDVGADEAGSNLAFEEGDVHHALPAKRVFRADAGRWQGKVHEVWVPDDPHAQKWLIRDVVAWLDAGGIFPEQMLSRVWIHHLRRTYQWERYEASLVAAVDDPDTPQAALKLASGRVSQGRFREAVSLATRYLATPEADPYEVNRVQAWELLCVAYAATGNPEASWEAWQRRQAEIRWYVRTLPALPPRMVARLEHAAARATRAVLAVSADGRLVQVGT
jgi:hypothetical protein